MKLGNNDSIILAGAVVFFFAIVLPVFGILNFEAIPYSLSSSQVVLGLAGLGVMVLGLRLKKKRA